MPGRGSYQVEVRVEIEGDRRDEPPGIVLVRYRLVLDSPEPPRTPRSDLSAWILLVVADRYV